MCAAALGTDDDCAATSVVIKGEDASAAPTPRIADEVGCKGEPDTPDPFSGAEGPPMITVGSGAALALLGEASI